MDASARLAVVACLYLLVGAFSCIELVVGWFLPVEEPLFWFYLYSPRLNVAPLLLPIGLGVLRRHNGSRRAAVVASWIGTAMLAIVLILVVAALAGSAELDWDSTPDLASGDALARTLGFLFLGLPLFVWQFRVLTSSASRELTAPSNPTAERE